MTNTSPYCRVLMLHRKQNEQAGTRGISLKWLKESVMLFRKNGFQFIDLATFQDCILSHKKFPHKSILVTIDDGYQDQVENLVPAFLKLGIKPVVFLITNFVEHGTLPWDQKIRLLTEHNRQGQTKFNHLGGRLHYAFDTKQERSYTRREFTGRCELLDINSQTQAIEAFEDVLEHKITREQLDNHAPASIDSILQMQSQGAEFANHSASHLIVGSNTEETCESDLNTAKTFISNHDLNEDVFAYAVGKYHSIGDKKELIESMGFKLIFNAIEGVVHYKDDPHDLNRIPYPESIDALKSISSPLAISRYDESNFLISTSNLLKLKFLIHRFGGKAAFFTWLKHQMRLYLGTYNSYKRIDYDQVKRVVFFCKGNINRSAIAEYVFRSASMLDCCSFGLVTEIDFPPSVEAQIWARTRNLNILPHRTTRVEDFTGQEGDLLVAFEPEQIVALLKHKPDILSHTQVTLAGIWASPKEAYIHDPVARPEPYFNRCFSTVEQAAINLAQTLTNQIKLSQPAL